MMRLNLHCLAALVIGCSALALACERPPMEVSQGDFRGLGVEQVRNPRIYQPKLDANVVPDPLPPAAADGPRASELFKNIQVLDDLSAAEMTRVMGAITGWVAAEQGCAYCHAGGNFAVEPPEAPYTKTVSRRMIEMTRDINQNWRDHVGETGVTCYTCHRGAPVPENYWVTDPSRDRLPMVGYRAGQNVPASVVGLTSMPGDPFTSFLLEDHAIRIQSQGPLPNGNTRSIKDAELSYGFMMHISTALGVNCTHCHNSRAFKPWEASSPARVTAWHGIQMARNLNQEYMEPLASVLPADRKGPAGDPFKIQCATCHQGLAKPLDGVSMVKDYPEIAGVR